MRTPAATPDRYVYPPKRFQQSKQSTLVSASLFGLFLDNLAISKLLTTIEDARTGGDLEVSRVI